MAEKKVPEKKEEPKQEKPKKEAKKAVKGDNVILVGKKGTMAYVLAAVTQFNAGAKEIIIKARGRAISKAVDVAEIVRTRSVAGSKIASIDVSTEEVQTSEGKPLKVSAIEIVVKK